MQLTKMNGTQSVEFPKFLNFWIVLTINAKETHMGEQCGFLFFEDIKIYYME